MSEFYLAATLFTSDGNAYRFGPDESSAEDMPKDIAFDTQNPGGFHTGSVVLPRPPKLRADEANLFADVDIYGPGGRVFYKGRVQGVPQVGPSEIRLELEGPVAALDDNEFFREIYVDRDLSRWNDGSTERRLDVVGLGLTYAAQVFKGSRDAGSTGPGVVFNFEGGGTSINIGEQWFYGGGVDIGKLRYDFAFAQAAATGWLDLAYISSDDLDTASDDGTDHAGVTASNQTVTASTSGRKYASVQSRNSANPNSAGVHSWVNLAVIGRHGLTEQGTWPNIGFRPSQILGHVIDNGTDLVTDYIEVSTIGLLTHFSFIDPVTPREVVERITALGSENSTNEPNDWGVYENGFFWRPPGSYGNVWRVRRDEFAESTSAGPAATERCKDVVITYDDGLGNIKSVGPVGSGTDFETADLEDTDASNPATAIGKRKQRHIGISYQDGAVVAGRLLLAESNALTQRGGITVTGMATDSAGNQHPACAIRAGDRIVIEDDDEADELPINSTSYSHGSMTLTANVGAAPHSLDTLLAQLSEATGRL